MTEVELPFFVGNGDAGLLSTAGGHIAVRQPLRFERNDEVPDGGAVGAELAAVVEVMLDGHELDPEVLLGTADLFKTCSAPAVGAVVFGLQLGGGHGGGDTGRGVGREGGGMHGGHEGRGLGAVG